MTTSTTTLRCISCNHIGAASDLLIEAVLTSTPRAEAQAAIDADMVSAANRGDGVYTGQCLNRRACQARTAALLAEMAAEEAE